MRLSLANIELVKKREKTSTIFSTFFDLKNKSQKLETAFLDFGTLYIKNPKVTQRLPLSRVRVRSYQSKCVDSTGLIIHKNNACACVVINSRKCWS